MIASAPRRCIELFFFLPLLAACGGAEDGPVDQRALLPAPPANGLRITLPEVRFQPAQERQLCVYKTLDNEEPMWIRAFDSYQGPSGHHLVAYTTIETEKDGTIIDCSNGERMVNWRLLFATREKGVPFTLPDGYAVKVEPHARLVLQTHYVNATQKPIVTQDALDLEAYPAGRPEPIAVAPFVVSTLDIGVPARGSLARTYECAVENDMQVMQALGHMHEWGTRLRIVAGARENPAEIYAVDPWTAEYRDRAPVVEWPMTDPLVVRANEVVRVTCEWQSDVDEELNFPKEMCAGVLWFFPAPSPVSCRGTIVE